MSSILCSSFDEKSTPPPLVCLFAGPEKLSCEFVIGRSAFTQICSLDRRSSIGTFIRPHSSDVNSSGALSSASAGKPVKAPAPRLDYRSMVSIDDMPELFASFDSEYLLQGRIEFVVVCSGKESFLAIP